MPTALLAGPFGRGDPGDEALVQVCRAALPAWDLVLTSCAPARAAATGLEAVPAWERRTVVRQATTADAVVVVGGNPFCGRVDAVGPAGEPTLPTVAAMATAARLLGKPVAVIGAGADHLGGAVVRRLASVVVRTADLLVLRDDVAGERLEASGVPGPFRIGADPLWTLVDPPEGRPRVSGDVVAVVLDGGTGPRVEERLSKALTAVAASGFDVCLQPWRADQDASDYTLAARLAAQLGGHADIAPPPSGVTQAREALQGCRAVVSLRSRGVQVAAWAGAPVVAFGTDRSLLSLTGRLGQPAIRPDDDPSELADAVLRQVDGDGANRSVVAGERRRAEEAFRLLRLLLSDGLSDDLADLAGLPLGPQPWPR